MSLSDLLREHGRRAEAIERHGAAEGQSVDVATALESYDRVLHPWMHGRRPVDLAARVRGWLP